MTIEPADGLDPSLTLREVFAQGPILLKLTHVGMRRVRLVIEAPSALKIMRTEAAFGSAAGADPNEPATPARRIGAGT